MPENVSNAVECVVKAEAIIGESPLWSPHERVLYWVDIAGQKIHRFNPQTTQSDTFNLPQPVTAVGLRQKGGLVITLAKNFAFFDPQTEVLEMLANPEEDKPANRFNDAKCDRQGRFWAGTMGAVNMDAPVGSLYRLDTNLGVTRLQTEVRLANGLAWSPDNRIFYFTESRRYSIYAYDFDAQTGNIHNRRLFVAFDRKAGGIPDGLTVDAQGFIWSALYGGGRVVRYSPAGAVERVVELPVPCPTSCIFGGDNLDVLYITTAREFLTPEQIAQAPLSGSLFAHKPRVQGLPEPSFAG